MKPDVPVAALSSRRRLLWIALLGTGVLVAIAAVVMNWRDDSRLDIRELAGQFALAPSAADAELGAHPALEDLDVVAESTRLLGTDDIARHWIAHGPDETELCLIITVRGGEDLAASTCQSLSLFCESGIHLSVSGVGSESTFGTRAILIPAGVDVQDPALSGVEVLGGDHTGSARLLVLGAGDYSSLVSGEVVELSNTGTACPGSKFTLRP